MSSFSFFCIIFQFYLFTLFFVSLFVCLYLIYEFLPITLGNFVLDHAELQATAVFHSGTYPNSSLMLPPSPIQTRRDSILKQQGSVKTEKRVSIKQNSSNLEYVSEKSNDMATTLNSLNSSKKRQGKPPSGEKNYHRKVVNNFKFNAPQICVYLCVCVYVYRSSTGIIGHNQKRGKFTIQIGAFIVYRLWWHWVTTTQHQQPTKTNQSYNTFGTTARRWIGSFSLHRAQVTFHLIMVSIWNMFSYVWPLFES